MIPYPSSIAGLLSLKGQGNRSLLFDRGMDRYDGNGKIIDKGKEEFLRSFITEFRKPEGFDEVLERRRKGFEHLGARSIRLTTRTRLVIGLGLPHPTETGFLLDRTTGCPYLPGSSVKGLVRAAARLAIKGDLEADQAFWSCKTIDRFFGPELGGGNLPRKGEAVFYDAFPESWPDLEMDVLTPHQGKYYLGGTRDFPADWNKPVPVSFLTLKPGTTFIFPIALRQAKPAEDDLIRLERLLQEGLAWLGIGAKKSSGYGYFGEPKAPKPSSPPELPPIPGATIWTHVVLEMKQGTPAASKGKQKATGRKDDLDPELLDALRDHRQVIRADVDVIKVPDGYRLARVRSWKIER